MANKTILVIEDNEDILEVIQIVLEGAGYLVVTSEDSSALKHLDTILPSLILMDNLLTDGLGSDFCRKLKDNEKTRHFPVVLISANTHLESMSIDCGANAYLAKPFDIQALVDMVNKFVD